MAITRFPRIWNLVAACVVGIALGGCAGTSIDSGTDSDTAARSSCVVLMVFDGDTVACDLNGNGRIEKPREYIRFLGIDAPETRHSKRYRNNPAKSGRDEPYAQEALNYVETRVLNQRVILGFDKQPQDRYGRTLAFLYASSGGTLQSSINEQLLEHGLAVTLFIPPNQKFRQRFERAEASARSHRRGIWAPVPDR